VCVCVCVCVCVTFFFHYHLRQVMWEPEPCVWMVLVVKRARPSKRDSDSYGDDDLRYKK